MPDPASFPAATPPGFTVRRVLVLAALGSALYVTYTLRTVLGPVFFAFLLAYALDPIVDRLQRVGVPRGLAAVLVMLSLVAGFVAVLVFAVPLFIDELTSMGAELATLLHWL